MRLKLIVLILFTLYQCGSGVDKSTFKTCSQSSFCRRTRKDLPGSSKFAVLPETLKTSDNFVELDLINKANDHLFILKLEALEDNKFRVQIDEKNPLKPRHRVTDVLQDSVKSGNINVDTQDGPEIVFSWGENKAVLTNEPFRIDFYQKDVLSVSVNAKRLMRFEHIRRKSDGEPTEDPEEWEEMFGEFLDSKPNGPEAIALDFSFPQADVLFGIPQHAETFVLKSTEGDDPYRLYNLDVAYYELESKMSLYGAVPVIYGHGAERSAGVFWHNAAETWVDIWDSNKKGVSSVLDLLTEPRASEPPAARFISESGIVDAFILLGPTPLDAFKQYTDLTGSANLPQLFTLAYHQCRWNYDNSSDVMDVAANYDNYDIPLDTMWLDIEYTDEKKYFTWDLQNFPDPLAMIKNLTDSNRHLTIIIDPHYKRDDSYFFHRECEKMGYYTKNVTNKDYEGSCWPGPASYPDFFNPTVRSYYAQQFPVDKFKTTTKDVMIWNDMNEPSVFNGPEKTMPKDNIHYGGWEHRDVHNMFGHMQVMGTFQGMIERDPNQRPFILTRSHFAGSQKYAIVWMGDNTAAWGHLKNSIKMCLSEAVAGFSFCGSDVGGFFDNPEPELVERWYQTGTYTPFFRAHANQDTKRREPWLFPEKTRLVIRDAVRKRYSYLPMWYTMFYEHEKYGLPVMRPLLAHYPKDKESYRIDTQFMLHDLLLICPVMDEGATKIEVYFPSKDGQKDGDVWFDTDNFQKYDKVGYETIQVDYKKTPAYQRGGTIIPKKENIRRTSTLMKDDPYTLVVCLDKNGSSKGTLYIDDEKSYEYRKGKYIYEQFEFKDNALKNSFATTPDYDTPSTLERVIIAGLEKTPKSATIEYDGKSQELKVVSHEQAVAIENPGVNIAKEFVIKLNY
ncbi:neutral alpha-glucosidase AB-like [Eupeodes corollae]|uniref:neutral alpha-glucosidase AB-like n=1 Tax=Eupeodes corollae TaxID=290404 RepID=UPI0024916249|nr:neutral alpha-glucosidase AB-like [Eupeodes corollae]